jgi:hypothetical protein
MNDIEFDRLLKTAVIKAAEIDYMSDMPSEEELSRIIKPSAAFEKKMAKLFKNPKSYIKILRRPLYVKAPRTVASILLFISIVFSLSMLNPDARAKFVALVRSWFGDHTEYAIIDDAGVNIPDTATLGYIPEGFSLSFEAKDPLALNITYRADSGEYFSIEIFGVDGVLNLDNEHVTFYSVPIDGNTAEVYESKGDNYPSSVVCYDEENSLIICITGTLNIDELAKVIEGLTY